MTPDAYNAACRALIAKLARVPAHLAPTGAQILRDVRALYDRRPT